MKIKIANIADAKNDASVISECANSFESLVQTMLSIRGSIDTGWSDCQSKFSAIYNLSRCAERYTYEIIPALKKLATAIDKYALANQQISSNSTLESAAPTNNSSSLSIENATTSGVTFTTLASSLATNTTYSNNANNNLDVSVYSSNPTLGFNVTTNNKKYNLSDTQFDEFCSIVSAEGDKSYDDSLAVATTILNRCENETWVNYVGSDDPLRQAKFPGQFVVVEQGLNKQYLNGCSPSEVKRAVADALAGVRNHDYLSFRSNESYSYSNNMITQTGNRYK